MFSVFAAAQAFVKQIDKPLFLSCFFSFDPTLPNIIYFLFDSVIAVSWGSLEAYFLFSEASGLKRVM